MKQMWKRLVALTLALLITLSVLPAELGTSSARAAGAYGKVTVDGVRVRKQPNDSAAYWFKVDTDFVCEILKVTTKSGVVWYKVNSPHPDPGKDRVYVGYIHGDYFTPLTEEELQQWEETGTLGEPDTSEPDSEPTSPADEEDPEEPTSAPTSTPTAAPDGDDNNTDAYPGATGQITHDGVNFRKKPNGNLIRKLDRGAVVEILTIPSRVDENHWYKVRYDGEVGYIMSTFLRVVSNGDPNGEATDPDDELSRYGYVKLIKDSANLRLSPGGKVGAQWQNRGEVLAVVAEPQEARSYTWYPVMFEGQLYYVREDVVRVQARPDGNGTNVTPAPTATPTVVGYVKTIKSGVNLRLTPGGKSILQVAKGVVLPMLSAPTSVNGVQWYLVQTADGSRGYMRHDCVKECNPDGSNINTPTATPNPSQQPDDDDDDNEFGYVKTIAEKVALRKKAGGTVLERIKINTVLPMTGTRTKVGKYWWYPVQAASGRKGFLRGDCVVTCNVDGSPVSGPTAAPTATPAPTASPAPTTAPTVSEHGYIKITKEDVRLRKTPNGLHVATLQINTVWPMTGSRVEKNGVYWYPVRAEGKTGYVRGDCCFKLSRTQEESYLSGNGVPDEAPEVETNYVITILDDVNLREAATKDSPVKFQVDSGVVMTFNTSAKVGGKTWYRVIYSNTEVWVLETCVRVMTDSEYQEWAEEHPNSTPQPEVIAGYVKLTDDGVNLRATPGGKVITRLDRSDSVYPYAKTETANGHTWYYVKTEHGRGYLRDDFVAQCQADGSALPTPTTDPNYRPPTAGQEASYKTLRRGSTGTAVKKLVQELKNQGFFTGKVTNKYTTEVEEAVKAFQRAKGLEVDGVAGAATQHALFQTVPIGSSDGSDLTMTIYPAEKIDWFNGGIQQMWPKGANFKVYDVKTGIVWWAHRWSGFNHVDAEPLTAADTARLCRAYGVSSAEEIKRQDLWRRRPMLVTIGDRTFACSLYGVPHNLDGDTIPNNNYDGQLCIHFTNSRTSDTNRLDSGHQEAIEYAYQHAPNGRK